MEDKKTFQIQHIYNIAKEELINLEGIIRAERGSGFVLVDIFRNSLRMRELDITLVFEKEKQK